MIPLPQRPSVVLHPLCSLVWFRFFFVIHSFYSFNLFFLTRALVCSYWLFRAFWFNLLFKLPFREICVLRVFRVSTSTWTWCLTTLPKLTRPKRPLSHWAEFCWRETQLRWCKLPTPHPMNKCIARRKEEGIYCSQISWWMELSASAHCPTGAWLSRPILLKLPRMSTSSFRFSGVSLFLRVSVSGFPSHFPPVLIQNTRTQDVSLSI